MSEARPIALIGYSGHAFVVCDIFQSQHRSVEAYCENSEKDFNPYHLKYLGRETEVIAQLEAYDYFVAIGDNRLREKVSQKLMDLLSRNPVKTIHQKASISPTAKVGPGTMIGDGVIVNACSDIGQGVICNTQSVVEHESVLGDYCHLGPGAVLCGNVEVGAGTFIGARSVVTPGVKIGRGVIIGAGTVVIKDIPDDSKYVGNPQRQIP